MEKENKGNGKASPSSFFKFSAIGFQMIATILVFAAIGIWLDKHFEVKGRYNTIFFMLFGVVGSITKFIINILNEQKRGE